MTSDEFLSRIDAHMERGNEYMERGNVLMAEVREEVRLTREFNAEQIATTRELMRRHEVGFKRGLEVIQDNSETMQDVRVTLRDMSTTLRRQQREINANTEWVKAQTQAMLKLVDEMRGGPDGS